MGSWYASCCLKMLSMASALRTDVLTCSSALVIAFSECSRLCYSEKMPAYCLLQTTLYQYLVGWGMVPRSI